uniref:titin-like n=1 Tax=Pristiophorus japonicus TaxID=55135 RepID=UPI00398F349A
MIFEKKLLQSEEGTKNERFSCSESLKRKWSCVYSNKYEIFFGDGREYLENRENLRDAFSDAEDYLDQGLVSADRCASRTSSISSWSENFRPSFTEKLKFKSVMEGEQAAFNCKLVASPAPKVAWFHNNRPIRKDSRRLIKTESTLHIHSSRLEINNVEEKDSGSYKIFAINSEGSTESTASLLVALKEEQNANYLSFVKRSEMVHKSIDSLVKKRDARLKVDLRHVGSPFDKKYAVQGVLRKQSHSKCRLMRSLYFERTAATTKHDDLFIAGSAEIRSPRLYGRILDQDSLIDEDIKIKLQLLREAKRKKRFSLALSEASFDLGTASIEDNLKYNYAYLDRERSRSVGDLDHIDFEHRKSYFVQEQAQSPGEYFQKESPEFQCRMERIVGLPSQEVEPQRAPEENIIEESSRTKVIKSLKEQFLKGCLSQETKQSHASQYWLEEQETEECYFQKECDTRKELESELCEEPEALSDQWVGGIINVQRDLLTKRPGEMFDPSTSAVKEAKLIKEAAQYEDSVDCAEILKKEKEFPMFVRSQIKQTPVEIKDSASKSEFKEDHEILSDQSSESWISMQNSQTKKTENSHSMFHHSRAMEINVSGFGEKEDTLMREHTQKLMHSPLSEKREASVFFRSTLDDNAIKISKTSCGGEVKEDPNTLLDQYPGSVLLKQQSGFDHRIIDQTESAFKENDVINVSKINQKEARYEGEVKDYTQMLVTSTLLENKETSGFVSSLMKETPEEVKQIPYKSDVKVNYETSLEQWPKRFISTQRDLLTQKPEGGHKISHQSTSAVRQTEEINMSKIQKNKQYEGQIIDSIHAVRHSPLTAKTREASTFVRTVIKQAPVEIKKPSYEFEVHEKLESTSDKRPGSFIHMEKNFPAAISEDSHGIQMPDQSKSAVKQTAVISVSKISQEEQSKSKVKDFTPILRPSISEKKETSIFAGSPMKETEIREPPYISEVKTPSDQFAGDLVSMMRDFVTEQFEDVHGAPNRSTPVVKQIEATSISKISQKQPQFEDKVKSATQIMQPSLPDRKVATTLLSSLIKETPMDAKEPPYDYKTSYDQKPGGFVHVQKGFLTEKPEEGHEMYDRSKLAAKQTGMISVAKIRQDEPRYEAKVLNSTWMVKPSPLPEKKEIATYVSSLKKQSPVDIIESSCKAEFKEDHETALESFTSMHEDFLTEKLQGSHGTSDQSAVRETAMISISEISQKELQHEWKVKPSIQTVRPSPLTEKNKSSNFFSSLMKETPTEVQEHQYKFVATKECLNQETPTIKLSQHCPPVFSHHVASPEIKQGDVCVLGCQFHGHPQPTVTWYKDEHPIPQNRDYDIHSTENKSTLSISRTCKEHEGVYTCVIFNQYGTATTSGILTIQKLEWFEESLKRFDVHVTEAQEDYTEEDDLDQLVEKEIESYFAPFTVIKSTLQLPKVAVPQPCPISLSLHSTPVEIKITAPTPTPEQNEEWRELLQLDEFDSKHPSQEPSSQTTKHTFKFSFDVISEPPHVIKELDKICCTEGESVMFECLISGEPAPVVTWIQNDRVLTFDSSKHRFEESGGMYRICINDVSASDVGNYKCVAKNKDGEAQSISSLTIEPAVHCFICHLKDIESSDEEAESSVSRFLLNLSKMGQGEDIVQQKQVSVQEGSRDISPSLNIKEKPFCSIPEAGGSVTSTVDAFSSKTPSLKEEKIEAVIDSMTSFSDEFLSNISSLREESNQIVTNPTTSFVDEFSSKYSSLEEVSNKMVTGSEVTGQKMPETAVEETYSVNQYLRSLDKKEKLSEVWKLEDETEPKGVKCVFLREMYEDSIFPETVIKQIAESNREETEGNVSEMELSGNSISHKTISGVNVDSIETISKKDEGSENLSIAQYLLTARQEEAPVHEEANNETSGYDESGITSMEVEEVTFAAVYDYYNQNEEWTRSLSPESEMSIEISSTISDDVAENERFHTPPLASENFRSAMSVESFHTPPQSPGYVTPPERLPSFNAVGRSPSGALLERFYTPPEYFRTPIDEGIETTPLEYVSLATEQQKSELFSTPPQEAEAKGNEMPPAFIKPLVRKRIYEGGTLTFIIEVIGCPIPDVKWYRRKSLLEANHRIKLEREGDLCILVIHNMQREDEGEYVCNAVNIIGEAKSITQVDVLPQDGRSVALPPPVTHQHVLEFDVQQGQTSRSPSPQEILLEVELDEHEVKEFEKQIKIITIPEFTPDNKNMIISLDVLPLMFADEHNVDFITKENEDVKIDFEVTEMPPRFSSHIFDLEIPENTDAIFECSVTGIPTPEIIWFKDDTRITSDGKKYIRTDNSNHSLKITNVCPSDNGIYSCKTVNSVGETTCRGYLAVTNSNMALTKAGGRAVAAVSLGSAQEHPQELDVVVGDSLLHGNQSSEIEVEFEFEQGKDDSQKLVKLIAVTEKGNEVKGEKCVNISFDVFAEPAKEETIQFKAEASETCSFEFQVTETSPKFVLSLFDCNTTIGSLASFQCFVTGTPKPNVIWYMDDRILEGANYIIEEKDSGHHYLNIANVTESDAGVYKCKAINKAGNVVTTAVLKILYI